VWSPSRGALVCALLLVLVPEARAEWVIDAEAGIDYETNLPRAAHEADRKSGVAFVPALSVGHYFQLTDATGLLATADFRGSIYAEYDGLTNLSSTATLALRHKLGLGAFAPWLRVFATGGALDYGDNVRDSAVLDVGVEAGKRFSERVDLRIGYTYERLDANDRVFDGESHTVRLKGSFGLTGALQASVGYGLRWGDLVVHKTPVPGQPLTRHQRIVDTFGTPMVASRIAATTHLVTVTLGHALTSHAALNAAYEYQISVGPQFDYPNHVVRASFDYSF
jgi:hypothetical protein